MTTPARRPQARWLKVMLLISLALVVIGVYRCTMELTPEPEGAATPDGAAASSGDSAEAPDSVSATSRLSEEIR
jgi:hypothetical protein